MLMYTARFQKIGISLLLIAFVFAAIILPLSRPPAILVETVALIASLEILFVLSLPAQQRICAGNRFRIRPRSPPTF